MNAAKCAKCGQPIDESFDGPGGRRSPCANCGATARVVSVSITETLALSVDVGRCLKRPRRSVGRHRNWGLLDVEESRHSHRHGKRVRVARRIDRDGDWYSERITNAETGEILREVSEPLSQHRGGGAARRTVEDETP